MKTKLNLLQGNITSTIVKLSLPLMGMSLLNTLYNLTDMFWIGQLGAGAVAAVGTGGLLIWLAHGLHMLSQVGGQVLVGQNLGAGEKKKACEYIYASIILSIFIGLLIGLVTFIFRKPIVAFFNLGDELVISQAEEYIMVACGFIFFSLTSKLINSLITATGNSKTPFICSLIGLGLNMLLDPIFILGLFGFPQLGVLGAAIATITAQIIVFILLFLYMIKDKELFSQVKLNKFPSHNNYINILKLSVAPALQGTLYPIISIFLSRMIADFGYVAVAAQRVGSQIESLSWMMSDGFSIAVNSFIAQNYGAKNIERAKKGFFSAAKILTVIGICVSITFFFFGQPIISLFFKEANEIAMGTSYLLIISISQLFMCYEILSNNSMNAFGKTVAPSLTIIVFTALRLPIGAFLSSTSLAVDGMWWAISISSILKGIVLSILILLLFKKMDNNNNIKSIN